MASQPISREKKEKALLDGQTTAVETPLKPKRHGASRERMLELTRIRQEKQARGEVTMGRPRTKFSRQEREDDAIAKLWPKALKVLKEQLEDEDPRIRQTAAIKVFEYVKGRPTQTVKQDINVHAIRFETAAVGGMMLQSPDVLELHESQVEEEDGDGDTD